MKFLHGFDLAVTLTPMARDALSCMMDWGEMSAEQCVNEALELAEAIQYLITSNGFVMYGFPDGSTQKVFDEVPVVMKGVERASEM